MSADEIAADRPQEAMRGIYLVAYDGLRCTGARDPAKLSPSCRRLARLKRKTRRRRRAFRRVKGRPPEDGTPHREGTCQAMIGFLKARAARNAAARQAAAKQAAGRSAAPTASPPAGSPATEAGAAAAASPLTSMADSQPATMEAAAEPLPPASARYEIRDDGDTWSVHDNLTGTVAEVHGFRLTHINKARAESLAEVLNRGEARRLASAAKD